MHILTLEGIPAIIFQTLLGGQFLTGYLMYLGATSSQIGLVLAIPTLANVLQIPFASFSHKLHRKWGFVTLASLHRICWAATGLIPFLFPQELWLAVYIPLYSLAFIANATSAMMWTSLVGDMVLPQVRARYMGFRNMVLNALGSLTLFAGGQILDRYPGGQGYHILFAIIGIMAVINIFMFTTYPNLPLEQSAERGLKSMVKLPLKDRSFMKATLFLSLWVLLQGIVVPLYSFIMLNYLKLSQGQVSVMTILQTLSMVVSFYAWGRWNMRHSNKTLLFWTLPIIAASCLSWGLLAILPTMLVLGVVHILIGFGTGGYGQLVFNFIIGDTPKSERPMFIAVYSAITGVTGFIGPILGGWILKQLEGSPFWLQSYGVAVAAGAILLALTITLARKALR
ncbi:MFS transporter [Gorillibacterium timonense]|uniref:MFS transporter n=1 Tax=Gorillibacterium timonense TaxID=1689269 RepID=UPI001F3BA6D8|nr:MFS transporter [Gorillibacterium timonense]